MFTAVAYLKVDFFLVADSSRQRLDDLCFDGLLSDTTFKRQSREHSVVVDVVDCRVEPLLYVHYVHYSTYTTLRIRCSSLLASSMSALELHGIRIQRLPKLG